MCSQPTTNILKWFHSFPPILNHFCSFPTIFNHFRALSYFSNSPPLVPTRFYLFPPIFIHSQLSLLIFQPFLMCFPLSLTNYTCMQWNPPPLLIPEHFRPHLHRKPPIFSHLATLAHQTHNFTPQHTFYNCQQLFQTLPHLLSTSFTSYRAPTHVFSWWMLIISEPMHIFNRLPVLAFSIPQTPFILFL